MNIKNKKRFYFSNTLDFFMANLIIILAVEYADYLIDFLVPPKYICVMPDPPKPYLPFIEGLTAGILMGVYMLLKRNINVLFMILGMWLYPLVKYPLLVVAGYVPIKSLESILFYLSELSMFIGIFLIIFYLVSFIVNRKP